MNPHFPPLEVTTQNNLGTLSALLAEPALPIAAVPATSMMAAYLEDERRRPHPLVKYLTEAPAEHLALLTPGEVPTRSSDATTANGVKLCFPGEYDEHNGFTLAHAAALFGTLTALRSLPSLTTCLTSQNMTCLYDRITRRSSRRCRVPCWHAKRTRRSCQQ